MKNSSICITLTSVQAMRADDLTTAAGIGKVVAAMLHWWATFPFLQWFACPQYCGRQAWPWTRVYFHAIWLSPIRRGKWLYFRLCH